MKERDIGGQAHHRILNAWADVDRLQTLFIKTPEKRSDRWMVEISGERSWPHRTAMPARYSFTSGSNSKKREAVTKGRVYVGAMDAQLLTDFIDDVLGAHS